MAKPMQDVAENVEEEEQEVEIILGAEETGTKKEESVEEPAVEIVEEQNEVSEDHDQEVAEYSDSVKKRIDKLTYKMREAERREQAALKYAEGVKNE